MFSLKGSLILGATACTLALSLPTEAKAHAIESSLRYLNGNLELRSTYSSGDPVNGAVVRFMKADGTRRKVVRNDMNRVSINVVPQKNF